MQKSKILGLGAVVLMAAGLAACGGNEGSENQDVEIDSFAFNQVLKSASRNYLLKIDGDDHYLNISARIAWPEKLGHADIAQLQDSLASYTFGDSIYATPDEAIINFIDGIHDLKNYFDEIDEISVVDSIPSDQPAFIMRSEAEMTDVNEEYVTYTVTNSQYLGGAHGEVMQFPFTYDLEHANVLTASDYFLPGHEKEVLDIIKQSLADQMGTTPEHLAKMGIFAYDNVGVGMPYIKGETLFIHYNIYEIAPYAAGQFDIPVSSVLISPYLRPEVKTLIGYDY